MGQDSCRTTVFLLWSHIAHLYYEDLEGGLKVINKLTSDHMNLISYAVMRVNLAAQALIDPVGNAQIDLVLKKLKEQDNFL